MSESPVLIGKIYAQWCGHCKILKPQWELMKLNIKNKFKNKDYKFLPKYMEIEDVNMYLIDNFNKKHANDLDNMPLKNNGFPTIFRVKNGRIDYYNGERNALVMEKWFMGNTHSSPKHRTISIKKTHRGGYGRRIRQTRKRYIKKKQ